MKLITIKKVALSVAILLCSFGLAQAQMAYYKNVFTATNADGQNISYTHTPGFICTGTNMEFCFLKQGDRLFLQAGKTTLNNNYTSTISITFTDQSTLTFTNVPYQLFTLSDHYIPTALLANADIAQLKTKKVDYFVVDQYLCNPFLSNFKNAVIAQVNLIAN